ncbi:MAG: leucyl/phenylalanyl-tRNA--protein transferase [Acidimicrobiales bacterium]|nr:leucyl/phenylalanyl-tRNA--protein transferase [Acidimicrobiales bacterium]
MFPPLADADADGPVAIGADLEPGTLLDAYRRGLFPMPLGDSGTLGWFSPDPRAILEFENLHISRSLRRALRRYRHTINQEFAAVIQACGHPRRAHGWIDPAMLDAYTRLHEMGWAESIEIWDDEELTGGLYGVRIGRFFAGESMFHVGRDASKVALVRMVEYLGGEGLTFMDVQWQTPHLASLGVTEIPRSDYLQRLAALTG